MPCSPSPSRPAPAKPTPIHDFAGAKRCDASLYARFFHGLLDRGVYFPPAQFEAAFISLANGGSDIDATIKAATATFRDLRH